METLANCDACSVKKEAAMKVEHILTVKGSDVYCVSPTSTVAEAVDLLGEKNVGAVIAKEENGRVAGILSERDVVRAIRTRGVSALNDKVETCMTANPFTCSLEATVNDVMTEMTEKRIRHMPVVRDGALVGLVSIGDVVKRKIQETEEEAAALKEYIAT